MNARNNSPRTLRAAAGKPVKYESINMAFLEIVLSSPMLLYGTSNIMFWRNAIGNVIIPFAWRNSAPTTSH